MEQRFRIKTSTGEVKDVTFHCHQNKDGTWYATGMGCSRDHAYWYHAIRELCDAECAKIIMPL